MNMTFFRFSARVFCLQYVAVQHLLCDVRKGQDKATSSAVKKWYQKNGFSGLRPKIRLLCNQKRPFLI